MCFIKNYRINRELKKFNIQEELRITKEKIKIENDLKIKRIKDEQVKLDAQSRCSHNYKVTNKKERYIHRPFNIRVPYYNYDLICTKCHQEQFDKSEEYIDYLLNKSKIVNEIK